MTEDDKEKLRRMLRCSYWEHLHTVRGRPRAQRREVIIDNKAQVNMLGDFLIYWDKQKEPPAKVFETFEDAYVYFDALIDGFEKVYCGLHCG